MQSTSGVAWLLASLVSSREGKKWTGRPWPPSQAKCDASSPGQTMDQGTFLITSNHSCCGQGILLRLSLWHNGCILAKVQGASGAA